MTKLVASNGVIAGTFNVGKSPQGICFDGANMWIANAGNNSVTKMVASNGNILGTFPVGNGPIGLAFNGGSIWVANSGGNFVTKLGAGSGENVGSFPVGNFPSGVAFDGADIWVTNTQSNTVSQGCKPMFRSGIALAAISLVACAAGRGQLPAPPSPIPPPGRMVDAGGHRLHLNCSGQGSPTVVMESGAGDLSLVWALVQPQIAQFTRACSYDRAGYAWSDAGPQPRTMAQIAYELHAALANAGEKGPYVLVGAALGGAMVRVFANTYPSDVSGMVLVDSADENGFVVINDKAVRYRETSQKRQIPPVQTSLKADAGAAEPFVAKPTKSVKFDTGNPRSKLPPDVQRIWMIARKQNKYTTKRPTANSRFCRKRWISFTQIRPRTRNRWARSRSA